MVDIGIWHTRAVGEVFPILQRLVGAINEEHGFHELEEVRNIAVNNDFASDDDVTRQQRLYFSEKLALVHSELSEALDELRKGKGVDETYYVHDGEDDIQITPESYVLLHGEPGKPEGFPSEIADAVIRCFDIAYEGKFDLGAIILEKLAYNNSRPFKHGKKF